MKWLLFGLTVVMLCHTSVGSYNFSETRFYYCVVVVNLPSVSFIILKNQYKIAQYTLYFGKSKYQVR